MTDHSTPTHKSARLQNRHSESNTFPFVENRSARLHIAVFRYAHQRNEPIPAWRIERLGNATGKLPHRVAIAPRYRLLEPSSVAAVNSSIGINHFAGVLSNPSARHRVIALHIGRIKAIFIGTIARYVNDLFKIGWIEADNRPARTTH